MPRSQVSDQPDELISESLIYGKTAGQKTKSNAKGIPAVLYTCCCTMSWKLINTIQTKTLEKRPSVMSETVVTFACCSKNKIHKMFQTEQKMNIRHEQAYNWFTIPRFKLKTKTCGKRDTSGRRGFFHTDQSRLLSSHGSQGKNKVCFYSRSYFHNGQRVFCQKEVCLCIKQAFIPY